ncbi:hypothetical protein H4R18_000260 [Coemansia javaensis]|uniref:Uncharacterized protein n=1 Tax=Coemansia javaensis TaxID=2761396 RepID=A0A9W8HIM4_9FUNG|nr:hypothetical protein H4R18_000260 [Coemansia javaensis]
MHLRNVLTTLALVGAGAAGPVARDGRPPMDLGQALEQVAAIVTASEYESLIAGAMSSIQALAPGSDITAAEQKVINALIDALNKANNPAIASAVAAEAAALLSAGDLPPEAQSFAMSMVSELGDPKLNGNVASVFKELMSFVGDMYSKFPQMFDDPPADNAGAGGDSPTPTGSEEGDQTSTPKSKTGTTTSKTSTTTTKTSTTEDKDNSDTSSAHRAVAALGAVSAAAMAFAAFF